MQKILLVEDEPNIARFVELELRQEGYEVHKAEDGREGLRLAEAGFGALAQGGRVGPDPVPGQARRRHGKEPLVFELDRPVAFAHPGLQPGAVDDRDVPPPIVDQPGRLQFSGGLGTPSRRTPNRLEIISWVTSS